jgi:hypothetical protein
VGDREISESVDGESYYFGPSDRVRAAISKHERADLRVLGCFSRVGNWSCRGIQAIAADELLAT